MNNLHLIIKYVSGALLLLFLIFILYIAAYRSAGVTIGPSGLKSDKRLVILGASIPYNNFTKECYRWIFYPIRQHDSAKLPTDSLSGTLTSMDSVRNTIVVKSQSANSIQLHVPLTSRSLYHTYALKDAVDVQYKLEPSADEPFSYIFELSSISLSR